MQDTYASNLQWIWDFIKGKLALKEDSSNKVNSLNQNSGADSKYPSVSAVKSYVDARIPSPPNEKGIYGLTVTINDSGAASYSWMDFRVFTGEYSIEFR
jgi:hypothetical protein